VIGEPTARARKASSIAIPAFANANNGMIT
jgi:hypothetical protein